MKKIEVCYNCSTRLTNTYYPLLVNNTSHLYCFECKHIILKGLENV